MGEYSGIPACVLLCLTLGLFAVSCVPSGEQAALESRQRTDARKPEELPKNVLSRERIIEFANAAAREHDWKVGEKGVVLSFDEGNARWKKAVRNADISQLAAAVGPVFSRHDWGPKWGEGFEVSFHEDDVRWKEAVASGDRNALLIRGVVNRHPDRTRVLKGRDFQVIFYHHQPPAMEAGLWVLVDRNTGEVLWVTQWP